MKNSKTSLFKRALAGFVSLMFVFTIFRVTSFASEETGITVSYDAVEKSVIIYGTSKASALSPVTFNMVSSETRAPSDSNLPVMSGMFFASEDGSLKYEAPVGESLSAGKYTVYLGMLHLDKAYEATIMIFDKNSTQTQGVLEAINDAKSDTELLGIISKDAGALGIDKEVIVDLEGVCRIVYGISEAEADFDYEGFDRAFKTGLAWELLKSGASADSVMNKYAKAFGTDYGTYQAMDENVKSAFDSVLSSMALDEGFVDFEDIEKLAILIGSETVESFKTYLLENADYFDVDIDGDYKKLSSNNKAKVFKTIYANREDFLKAADVAEAFDDAAKELLEEAENKKNSSSGSGGGGSGGGGGFSVAVPSTNAGVNPSPVPGVSASKYTDTDGHFAEASIDALSELGIINGFEDGSFRPNEKVTRAQISKMTVLALKLSTSGTPKSFADVSSSDWHSEYVGILSSNNIVSGDGVSFYPQNLVTRQDAALILYNALCYKGKTLEGESGFADDGQISAYAKKAVGAMAANKIILGDASFFRPLDNLTRGEAAVLIHRIINAV